MECFLRLKGIEWYLENIGNGKFWPDLETSEASFILSEFCISVSCIFLPTGLRVSDLSFFFLTVSRIFQSSWVQLIELS